MAKVKSDKKVKPSADIVKSGKKSAAAVVTNGSSKAKKSKKAPTPEPESESDDVSDASSDASESEDSEDSESSDSSESEAEAKPKANGVKVNGTAATNGASKHTASDSEDSSDDSSESEDEKPAPKAAAKPAKKVAAAAKAAESSSEEDSEASDDSDDEAPAKTNGKAVKAAPAVNGNADSDDDSSEGDDDDDSSASSEEEAPAPKKRKADAAVEPATKKTKTEAPANENASLTLFVGNLSWNVDEEWLRQEFSELGNITGCRVLTDPATGRSKGMGYVDFATTEEAAAALAAKKDQELDGRAMNVDFAQPRGERKDKPNDRAGKFGDTESPPSDTLFVGNIPFEAEAHDVKAAFEEHVAVVNLRLPTDRETGAPKGFGYVSFASVEDAKAAKEAMTGFYMGSRPLRLDFAQPRDESQGGGRGGFGGGRGRGGFGDRGGRGGGRGRGGFGDRGGRGGGRGFGGGRGRGGDRGGRGNFSSNRGGVGDFSGKKVSFD